MKLERIHVERYGAWQNLDLPVDSEAVSVFFGPNEAGKTTLMRFVRGVLYGFDDDDAKRLKGADAIAPWGGSLQVQHDGASWLVRRIGKVGTRGLVTARRLDRLGDTATDGAALVRDLVGDVSETVYENVFAIGLPELQTLATLETNEVAEHIYSLSMGLEGQRLLKLIDQVRQRRSDILDVERGTGRLTEFYQRLEDIDLGLDAGTESRKRYGKLSDELKYGERSMSDMQRRQRGLEEQLHGHEYMDLIHEPWSKVRAIERELATLPQVADFPRAGIGELTSINHELNGLQQRRKKLLVEAKELKAKRRAIEVQSDLGRYAPTLQSFVDQREWLNELIAFVQEAQQQHNGIKTQLDAQVKALGADWSIERLKKLSVSHLGTSCLTQRGQEFQTISRRTKRLQKHYQQLSKKCHRRGKYVEHVKEQLGGEPLRDAIARTREELAQLEDLSRLRIREAELQQRKVGVANQLHRLQIDPSLPQWVSVMFTGLGIAGLVLGLAGLSIGIESNFIAGMGYFMLAVFCEGVIFGLKRHLEREVESSKERLQSELRELELRLEETRESIRRIVPNVAEWKPIETSMAAISPAPKKDRQQSPILVRHLKTENGIEVPGSYAEGYTNSIQAGLVELIETPLSSEARDAAEAALQKSETEPVNVEQALLTRSVSEGRVATSGESSLVEAPSSAISEADLIRQCVDRIRQLEKVARVEDWVAKTRQRLIGWRVRLRDANRDLGTARQNWCHHLRDLGLSETVDIDAAFAQRDEVARAAMLQARLDELQTDVNLARRLFQRFRARVEELGLTVLHWKRDYSNPVPVLDEWRKELVALAEKTQERRRLRSEIRSRLTQASACLPRLRKLQSQQSALLVRGGALSIDEFKERAAAIERRLKLEAELEVARDELATAASTERSLAIVESDLEHFDRDANDEALETIRQELDDLALEIEESAEKLKTLKRDLRAIEDDSTFSEMRFEREQVMSEITTLSEEWFALEWSLNTLDSLRLEFERNHQTPILMRAKEYLRRLSGDRYQNIWSPLGERTLCVDNESHESIRIENLSSGAQEQLFLAIRLALIEHFKKEGIELPVVLDDVLVNFDQDRTRAAIDELLRLSANDQQILFFTCHQHVTDMFRQRGVSTTQLPSREVRELLAG